MCSVHGGLLLLTVSPGFRGHSARILYVASATQTGTHASQSTYSCFCDVGRQHTAEVARCKPLVEAQAGQAVRWTSIGGNAGYLNLSWQIQVRNLVMQVDAISVTRTGPTFIAASE